MEDAGHRPTQIKIDEIRKGMLNRQVRDHGSRDVGFRMRTYQTVLDRKSVV